MSRNEIVEAIVDSDIVPRYVNKFYRGSYREDVVADLYFIILHLPQGSLERAYLLGGKKGVFRLVAGVLKRQLISTSSYIYVKYSRHEKREKATEQIWKGSDDSQDE